MIAQTSPSITKSAHVYGELRREIASGIYKPGQRLVRRDFAKKYAVSLSVVNEALARLVSDGLIESRENETSRVINPDSAQIQGDFMLREAIERQVARLLAGQASEAVLNSLLQDAQAIDRWIASEGPNSSLHLEFHLKMARSTGYASLERTLMQAGIRHLMTVRWLQSTAKAHPKNFHEQLVRAFLQRDENLADRAMFEHLHFGEDVLPELKDTP